MSPPFIANDAIVTVTEDDYQALLPFYYAEVQTTLVDNSLVLATFRAAAPEGVRAVLTFSNLSNRLRDDTRFWEQYSQWLKCNARGSLAALIGDSYRNSSVLVELVERAARRADVEIVYSLRGSEKLHDVSLSTNGYVTIKDLVDRPGPDTPYAVTELRYYDFRTMRVAAKRPAALFIVT